MVLHTESSIRKCSHLHMTMGTPSRWAIADHDCIQCIVCCCAICIPQRSIRVLYCITRQLVANPAGVPAVVAIGYGNNVCRALVSQACSRSCEI